MGNYFFRGGRTREPEYLTWLHPDLINQYEQYSLNVIRIHIQQVVTRWGYLQHFGSCIKREDFLDSVLRVHKMYG